MADGDYERVEGRMHDLARLNRIIRESREKVQGGISVMTFAEIVARTKDASVKGVVFDFGGVMTACPMKRWEETLYPFCGTLGLTRETARAGFLKYRNLWDGGELTFEELYGKIFADDGLPRPTDEQMRKIWEFDAVGWVTKLRAETLELMKDCKARGKKVGILSNMSSDFFERLFTVRLAEYREIADVEVISGLVKMCKPDRPIYDYTVEKMGIPPYELLFVDDTEANVRAARSYGWQAELYPPCFL